MYKNQQSWSEDTLRNHLVVMLSMPASQSFPADFRQLPHSSHNSAGLDLGILRPRFGQVGINYLDLSI
jgi:hypothetical protein